MKPHAPNGPERAGFPRASAAAAHRHAARYPHHADNDDRPLRWSVILPYFNERDFIGATLQALLAQTLRPLRLILVDNGSTDGSEALARAILSGRADVDVLFLSEPRPGKLWALRAGLAAVETEWVATCDADTYYPPDYLAEAARLAVHPAARVAGVMATGITGEAASAAGRWRRYKTAVVARLLPSSCHTGGFGQCFRTAALRAAGGFDPVLWPFVLEDHEVINRLRRFGVMRYSPTLWCRPSQRRADRSRVDWTLVERLSYNLLPGAAKDWFFHAVLAPRLRARGMSQMRLREKLWEDDGGSRLAA